MQKHEVTFLDDNLVVLDVSLLKLPKDVKWRSPLSVHDARKLHFSLNFSILSCQINACAVTSHFILPTTCILEWRSRFRHCRHSVSSLFLPRERLNRPAFRYRGNKHGGIEISALDWTLNKISICGNCPFSKSLIQSNKCLVETYEGTLPSLSEKFKLAI